MNLTRKKNEKDVLVTLSLNHGGMKESYNRLIECYIRYKQSGFNEKDKLEFTHTKREFKVKKRLNIKIKRDRSLRRLNSLFNLDKISFWKKIKAMKKNQQIIDLNINKIRDEYFKQFNERISLNSPNEQENKIRLKEFIDFSGNSSLDYSLSTGTINGIIEYLPNGKSIGIGGVAYETLKYYSNETVSKYLKILSLRK